MQTFATLIDYFLKNIALKLYFLVLSLKTTVKHPPYQFKTKKQLHEK